MEKNKFYNVIKMSIEIKKINNYGRLSLLFSSEEQIEYSINEFKPEMRMFAERQIASYQKKVDNLQALNHPEMKPEYIKRINMLILIDRGEFER